MARGRGMSRYAGMRLSLLQTPGSDMAQFAIRAKGPEDGWDEFRLPVVVEQIFCGPITSTDSALEAARDFLDEVIRSRKESRWGPE